MIVLQMALQMSWGVKQPGSCSVANVELTRYDLSARQNRGRQIVPCKPASMCSLCAEICAKMRATRAARSFFLFSPMILGSLKAGTHEGACSWNTLPKHAPQPVHTKDTTRELNDETTRLGHGNCCGWKNIFTAFRLRNCALLSYVLS